MHFSNDRVRMFNIFIDNSQYFADFEATWFSKFMAPDVVIDGKLDTLQVKIQRNKFLESFSTSDVVEIEFIVLADQEKMKVMKTVDAVFQTEADVDFQVIKEIEHDEDYNFPEEPGSLLVDTHASRMKTLRYMFKKARQEFLNMTFIKDHSLDITGDFTDRNYNIKANQMESLGTYLCGDEK